MTTTETYRIKPLVWEKRATSPVIVTTTMFGKIKVVPFVMTPRGKWWVDAMWDSSCSLIPGEFESAEAAQLAAESWYRERLLAALEKVT